LTVQVLLVVLLVVHAAFLVTVLLGPAHVALAVQLLFSHAVELVLFVVSVSHDARDRRRLQLLLLAVALVLRLLLLKLGLLLVELHRASLVDLLGRRDGVFQVDRHFVVALVRGLLLLLIVVQLNVDLIVVHDAL